MKSIHSLVFISIFGLTTTGCSVNSPNNNHVSNFLHQEKIEKTSKEDYPKKKAQQVAVFDATKIPTTPYKVIGTVTISKKSLLGEERENEDIHKRMKQLAAAMGGDGILKVDHQQDKVVATIIAYQKILL